MTKDVLLSVTGLQLNAAEEETEEVEIITPAVYYLKNDKHYILYDEMVEGYQQKTKNVIKVGKRFMEVTKKGFSDVTLLFQENKKHSAYYHTPYGDLMIGIEGRSIKVEEEEDLIKIQVDYILDINQSYLADCTINMRIQAKNEKSFTL